MTVDILINIITSCKRKSGNGNAQTWCLAWQIQKVVIVGIPGVGKTSLVTKLVELIKQQNKTVGVHSFGTVMLEEAMKNGIKDRDELRRLPIENNKNFKKWLQKIFQTWKMM